MFGKEVTDHYGCSEFLTSQWRQDFNTLVEFTVRSGGVLMLSTLFTCSAMTGLFSDVAPMTVANCFYKLFLFVFCPTNFCYLPG